MNTIKISTVILIIFTFFGCSVKYSFTGASISPDVKTVYIKKFPNMAPLVNPTLSQTFTEGLKDRFISQTSLVLLNKNGDLNFEGEIIDYNTKPVAITADDKAARNRLTISIRVKFTNTKDSEQDFDVKFTRHAEYNSSESLYDVEDGLVTEILEEIFEDIFNKSVANW